MTTVEAATQSMAGLSRAEWIARDIGDAFPGIEATAGVMGGAACVRHTRIAVWLLVQWRRQGLSDLELLQNYPQLTAEDLANAWAYARSHRPEIEAEIVAQEAT